MEAETENKMIENHGMTLLEWETPEFIPLKRGPAWYLVAFLILAFLIGYALVTESFTMAIVFVMLAAVFLLTQNRHPRMITIRFTDLGVHIGRHFYSYHQVNAFWIIYHPPYVRSLYFRISQGKHFKIIKVELNHQDPREVREVLLNEVPEIEGAHEPMADILTRILRLQ
jgi:hypothetical protein